MKMKKINITEIDGFRIGNAEDEKKGTGCTVVVCPEGAVGGVDVRGGRPATRETDMLRSESTAEPVNAVVISGGSAFGLEAASGVMRELAGKRIGADVGGGMYMPIVCGASLFDLMVGSKTAFPDIAMGMDAAKNAFKGTFEGGNKGAGTGATVGKIKGMGRAMKSGLGSYACSDGKLQLGAVVAVNACGDVYNANGDIVAGMRSADGTEIYGTLNAYKDMLSGESDKKTPASASAVKSVKQETARREEPSPKKAAAPKKAETEEPAPRKRSSGTRKKRDRNAPRGAFSLRNAVTTEAPSKEEIAAEEARRAEAERPEPEVEIKHLTPQEALKLAAAKQDAERAARYGLTVNDKSEPEDAAEEQDPKQASKKISDATEALKKAAETKAAVLRLLAEGDLLNESEIARAEEAAKAAAENRTHKPKHVRTEEEKPEEKPEIEKRLSKTDRVAAEAAEALKIELEAEDEGAPEMVAVNREEAVEALKKEIAAEDLPAAHAAGRRQKRSAAGRPERKKAPKPAVVIKEEPEAPPVKKEEPKAAPVKKEEPKPAAVVKEEPKAAPVKKEESEAFTALKEELKHAAPIKEEPKPAPVVKEEPKAAPVKKEEPKPASVVKEEPKAVPVKKEEPKPAPVVKEEPKAAPVKKEEPKPAPVVKEEPKAAPVKKEEPKPAPVVKEEPKAVPVKKEEPVKAPEKEEAKSVVVKAEPVKTLRKKAAKTEPKPEAKPEPKPEPAAVEDEPLYEGPLIEDPVVADYLDYDSVDEGFVGRHGRRSEKYKNETPSAEAVPENVAAADEKAASDRKPAEESSVIADDKIIGAENNNGEDPYYYDSDDDDMGYDIEFNTTIACLVTNAKLTNSQANMLASILHDAYARSIRPVHGTKDGDTIFVLALGKEEVNFDAFAALATDIMQHAVIDGASSAEAAYGLPAARDMKE